MTTQTNPTDVDVFISYSSQDRDQVHQIAARLEASGLRVWVDRFRIPGGTNYGPEIVRGIRECQVLMLMCSDNSMRSKNVRQEIQLAWKYSKPYLPLLLEPIGFPEQVEYWLEGWQWIEVLDLPTEQWLPKVLDALANAGVHCIRNGQSMPESLAANDMQPSIVQPVQPAKGLEGLRAVASFTDQIWPLPANRVQRGIALPATRGLGAPQDDLQHGFRIGGRVCLAIESDREGYLLLLDEGPEGIIYCLCPSWFAPDTRLRAGRSYLPQEGSRYDSFVVTGKPGREHLLAIITEEPLGLDWMPPDSGIPARTLSPNDIDSLLTLMHSLEGDRWTALSTYFDVLAR